MEVLNQTEVAGGHMEVARLARWLWQQAGSPPGKYRDFWMKVATSQAAALQAKEEALTAASASPQSSVFTPSHSG
jgi:hypothetical protein